MENIGAKIMKTEDAINKSQMIVMAVPKDFYDRQPLHLLEVFFNYSDLPNNRAANLIIFWEKNTYTTLLGPTRLLISDIFPSKPDFHLHK